MTPIDKAIKALEPFAGMADLWDGKPMPLDSRVLVSPNWGCKGAIYGNVPRKAFLDARQALSDLSSLKLEDGDVEIETVARMIAARFGSRITGPSRCQAVDEGYSPFPEIRGNKYSDDNWPKFKDTASQIVAFLGHGASDV